MLITRGMGISNSGGGSGENVYVPVSDPLITTNILGSTNMILTSNNPSLNIIITDLQPIIASEIESTLLDATLLKPTLKIKED
jgi:hypothetical protein